MREINQAGLDLIKEFEGCVLHVYNDSAGLPTIGVGHLIKAGESFTTITQDEADALLRSDLAVAEAAVDSDAVTVQVSDNQFAAMVSLTFNIGTGAFGSSTLLKKLNAGDYQGAADQFPRWNKAGGVVVAGLTRRREAERTLFLTE